MKSSRYAVGDSPCFQTVQQNCLHTCRKHSEFGASRYISRWPDFFNWCYQKMFTSIPKLNFKLVKYCLFLRKVKRWHSLWFIENIYFVTFHLVTCLFKLGKVCRSTYVPCSNHSPWFKAKSRQLRYPFIFEACSVSSHQGYQPCANYCVRVGTMMVLIRASYFISLISVIGTPLSTC